MDNDIIDEGNEHLFSEREDICKDSFRKNSTDDGDQMCEVNGVRSLKERSPDMMESIMTWLEKKGVKMGNPEEIKECSAKEKKAECLENKSTISGASQLLKKRLKRTLTVSL